MKTDWKEIATFWSILLIALSVLLILQTSFLPDILLKNNIVPQLTLPVVIYFFSQRDLFSSLLLVFFISLISSNFTKMPLSHLLLSYFTICAFVQLSYQFYFANKKYLFLILLFVISFFALLFPQNLLSETSSSFYLSTYTAPALFSSFITTFFGFLIYPFLQKQLKESVRF